MALSSRQYRSLYRPSSTGSVSSYASSLAKKQASAEDAVIDDRYDQGLISAEAYVKHLNERTTRSYLTPLQLENLNQKIRDVQIKVYDSEVDRKYASGELNTDQVLAYEKAKLGQMTATNSAAYQEQARKVQGLVDKAEREKRTQFRVSENLRISEMPEDSSERLYAKAAAYEQLEAQARADGDNQTADGYLTQKNNYIQSAKRADINDLITGARLATSETPTAGLGVPSADAGQQLYSRLLGLPESSSTPSGTVSPVPGSSGSSGAAVSGGNTGFKGTSSPAMRSAFEAIDRSQKQLDRLGQQRADKQALLETYNQAIDQATGDQKTQLVIARNGIVDEIARIDNSTDLTISGIEDKIARVQEIQASAAKSAFSQEVRVNNQMMNKAETDLETEFSKGKITKEEYIQKGIALAEAKTQFNAQASDIFAQFGNDSSADAYLQKAEEIAKVHENLLNVGENLEDYEQVHVDPGGRITNLFGKSLKPGDFALQNVRQLKDSGVFQTNYIQNQGKYYQIHYPNQLTDVNGFPTSAVSAKEIGQLENNAFVYKVGENGKQIQEPVKFVKYNTVDQSGNPIIKPYFKTAVDQLVTKGALVQDKDGSIRVPEVPQQSTIEKLKNAGANVIKAAQDITGISPETRSKFFPQLQKTMQETSPASYVGQAISGAAKNVGNFFSNAVSGVKNLFSSAKDSAKESKNLVQRTLAGFGNLLVPRVEASETASGKYDKEISSAGIDLGEATRVLKGENGARNPRAENRNNDGSIDRGLFQINSNTFADFQRRKGDLMAQAGIRSYEDMFDPAKNAKMAKIIKDEQGWAAWYGAPDDLRNGTGQVKAATTVAKAPIEQAKSRVQIDTSSIPSDKILRAGDTIKLTPPSPTPTSRVQAAPTNIFQNVASGISNLINPPKMVSPVPSSPSPVQNVIKNVTSGVSNLAKQVQNVIAPPKMVSPVPTQPKPNIIQQAVSGAKNVVGNVVNTAKSVLSKLKFW